MSPSVDPSFKKLLEPSSESENLDSQISGIRQRTLKRQQEIATPFALPVRTDSQSRARWTLLIFIVLALVLAYGGQLLLLGTLRGEPDEVLKQALAGSMLISGALLFGAFMPAASGFLPRLEFPVPVVNPTESVSRNRWALSWVSAAVVLVVIAIILFATLGESLAVILIWFFSILSLAIAQIPGMRSRVMRILPEERMYAAALMVLLLITLITRVYHLTTLPYNFDGDYASVGLEARALISGQRQIFAFGWAAIPVLGYLPAGLAMSLFGDNLAGLNASGVMEGLLIIVGVYMLGRDLVHKRVGLLAAALLTISYAHLAASRQSVYLDPVVVLVFAIYFLFVGLREARGGAIVTSGVLTAFCLQVYYPSRIIVFIVGFMLFYLLLFRSNWLKRRWWTLSLWALAVLIALGPMLVVFARNFDWFMIRTRDVFILNPTLIKHSQVVYQVETVADILLEQARRSALMFHYYNDTGTQFSFQRPFLDPFTAPLFTLGMGYALFHWRRFGHALVLAWTVLSVLVGCFLTGNPPFWARLMILLPPTALLAALALNMIYELANRGLEHLGNWARPIAPAAIVLCLTLVGVLNWNTYVELKGTYGTPHTHIARYLINQPPSVRAYLISSNYTYRNREFQFLVPERLVADLTPEQVEGEITPLGSPTLLILMSEHNELLQRLQQRFPNGTTETHIGNSPNEIAFYVFRLP